MHHEDVKAGAGLSFLRPLFSDTRIAAMLVLGFASGIPYQLVYIT
jgi:MFS transporter, PAT family, beta-lactamase induction signal transducer AmpG